MHGTKILVISQYYYPEQFRINDICQEWVKRGYQVTVITGIPNYPLGQYYPGYGLFNKRKETYNGVQIIRLPLVPRGQSRLMLALNYLSFVVSGFFWSRFTGLQADLVFIFEVSPMSQSLPGVWFAKRRQIPCHIYVQDLWPENLETVAGIKNPTLLRWVNWMVDYIYHACHMIYTTSNSFRRAIQNRGVSADKIQYWPQYAEDFYQPVPNPDVSEIKQDGCFNLIFTGNIGAAQGLEILPEVASLLNGEPIQFNIVGDGRFKQNLIEAVQKKHVDHLFNFIGQQPADRIPAFLAWCDAAILCLNDDPLFNMTIPAKLQSYLACGIPIVAAANGETAAIIHQSGCGYCSPAGDIQQYVEIIRQMINQPVEQRKQLGDNGHQYALTEYNKMLLLDLMDNFFANSLSNKRKVNCT